MADYKPTEMMTIAAARLLKNDDICFVGIGQPSAACNLARLTHAPDITLIYESGTLATKPTVLPLSIGDGELCDTALTTVSVPEMFRYWLQGGRIKVGFLGGAQIDKFANLNTTVVGPYDKPKVRLPGGAFPSYAQGYYPRNNSFYKAWDDIAKDRDSFHAWMKANVLDKGPEAFVQYARKHQAAA